MASTVYDYPGKLELDSIVIKAANGTELNITPQTIELNIFESLFGNIISGSLTIIDSIGLISKLPIIGFESVTCTLKTPTDETRVVELFVYKISPRLNTNEKTAVYVLNLLSYEGILDQCVSYSKSYKGKYSDIIKKILKDSFPSSVKAQNIEDSSNESQFILPYWNPFQAINWLANRALPIGSKFPSYFFYETLSGFNFKSIEQLNKKESQFEYILRPHNTKFTANSILDKMKTIQDIKFNETASTLETLSNGGFGSQMYVRDLNSLSYNKKGFAYTDTFSKYNKLNQELIKPKVDGYGNTLERPNNTRCILNTSDTFTQSQDTDNFLAWVLERKSLIEQLMASNVEILVHGHIGLHVGDCVDLFVPENSANKSIDRHASGKYMIVGIRHIINHKIKHMMSLELSKDSFIDSSHLAIKKDNLIKA